MRAATLVTVVGLTFTTAAPAAADQWVLWLRTLDGVAPMDTYATKAACQAQARPLLAALARQRRETGDDVVERGLTVLSRVDAWVSSYTVMECWPPGVTPSRTTLGEVR